MKCFAIIALAAVASAQVTQISDGQVQAPTAVVTQITDGQIQAPPNATVPPPFAGDAVSSTVSIFSIAMGAVTAGLAVLL